MAKKTVIERAIDELEAQKAGVLAKANLDVIPIDLAIAQLQAQQRKAREAAERKAAEKVEAPKHQPMRAVAVNE